MLLSVTIEAFGCAEPPSVPAADMGSVPRAYSVRLFRPSWSGSAELAAFPESEEMEKWVWRQFMSELKVVSEATLE